MKTLKAYFVLAASAGALASAAPASATTLDFTTLPSGDVPQNTYAGQGVSAVFTSAYPSGPATDAQANIGTTSGLTNSIYGAGGDPTRSNYPYYPTNQYLTFDFSQSVSGVSFDFNNYGDNGLSSYTAYDASNNVIATGLLPSVGLQTVAGSGIASLVISNGEDGSRDWIYGVQDLSFSATPGPVPGAGLAGFAALALAGVYARARRA